VNGYSLSRNWFNFCFANPEKIKPRHTALYFFAIEHCNRLGWKEKYNLPAGMTMESIGISSYNTYSATLRDLIEWKFIIMVKKSKNQYSANTISLAHYKSHSKSLDHAIIRHKAKENENNSQQSSLQGAREQQSDDFHTLALQAVQAEFHNRQAHYVQHKNDTTALDHIKTKLMQISTHTEPTTENLLEKFTEMLSHIDNFNFKNLGNLDYLNKHFNKFTQYNTTQPETTHKTNSYYDSTTVIDEAQRLIDEMNL